MDRRLRKGIIMAAGSGSRLSPTTLVVSKHLFPVFNKPMIYYPLTTLMLAGVKEILIITCPEHLDAYKKLLKDGDQWGITLTYATQNKPKGIADGLLIAREFLQSCPSLLILGDNIFFGDALPSILRRTSIETNATILSYRVKDPERYAVVSLDKHGKINCIKEKPEKPSTNEVVTGIYFLPENAVELASTISPSERGELEITDVLNRYLADGSLKNIRLGRGMTWFDVGTYSSLLEASQYISVLEGRQGQKIAWPDEIAGHSRLC